MAASVSATMTLLWLLATATWVAAVSPEPITGARGPATLLSSPSEVYANSAAAVCAACAAACAAAAVSSAKTPSSSDSKEATTTKTQLLFVDEDSHEDAIKESKGGSKVGAVPEIVSFAGYKGYTLDDLPVDPEYSPSAPSWTRTDFQRRKPSWNVQRLQGNSEVPVWTMRRGGVHERWGPFEQTLPYGPSGGSPTFWRPSTPPRRASGVSPGIRGGSSHWCPPKPINPPYNPPYNPQKPPYIPPYNPPRPVNPTTPRPPYPLVPPSPKPVDGVADKLDWSNESGEDDDKTGNGNKGSDDDKKVIAVVDKLDLDAFSR